MARNEQGREDILQEATALVQRAEFRLANDSEPIVVGFRHDGAASFYFGAEPVLQFNAQGELRRAHDDGALLKASRGRLIVMRRVRQEHEVTLHSRELTVAESKSFCQRMLHRLETLRDSLQQGTALLVRQVPVEIDVSSRVLRWLEGLESELPIASVPNSGGAGSPQR